MFGVNCISNLHLMPDQMPTGFPKLKMREAMCSALQPDGKLLLGGYFDMGNSSYGEVVVARLRNTVLPPTSSLPGVEGGA